MCYVRLQNVLALKQGSTLPAQLVQPLREPTPAVHTDQPHAWLSPWAQHMGGNGCTLADPAPIPHSASSAEHEEPGNLHPCCQQASILKNAA